MSDNYILDENHNTIKTNDLMKWAAWFETADRKVKATELPNDVKVSTVFLGLDHNWINGGDPILFETMVFGGVLDREQDRYSTWKQAEKGHEEMVKKAEKSIITKG